MFLNTTSGFLADRHTELRGRAGLNLVNVPLLLRLSVLPRFILKVGPQITNFV